MTVAKFNKLWRPLTATGLAINLVSLPGVYLYLDYIGKLDKESSHLWIYLYGAMATLFAALAGIRQVDKNKQHEITRDINIASLGYNPTGQPTSDQFIDNYRMNQNIPRRPRHFNPTPPPDVYTDDYSE